MSDHRHFFLRLVAILLAVLGNAGFHCRVLAADTIEKGGSGTIPDGLANYLERDERKFAWKLEGEQQIGSIRLYRLQLTSQTWQNLDWQHALFIFEPKELRHPDHMLLFITGGRTGQQPKPEEILTGSLLAQFCGTRVASLHQVPNQPLLGHRVEDDLITETWLRYLETGDETWPLLFPMVKSAVKAMDALQEFSTTKLNQKLNGFVVTGASKRGWTTWLTAAADKRVRGAAPMVIDFLNFREQMRGQKEIWGHYSEQIADYTSKGLIKEDGVPRSTREDRLWAMMDPYTYRDHLTLPKLLIVGANDRYWMHDAMSIYWKDLQGPKAALRIPNAGHNLKGGREQVMATVGAFVRHVARGVPFPEVTGRFEATATGYSLTMLPTIKPHAVKVWTATASGTDFREAEWNSQSAMLNRDGSYLIEIARPQTGHVAVFGECQYLEDDLPYAISTLLYWK